jgi:hypothetical protein
MHMLKRTCPATVARLTTLALFAIGAVAWGDVPLPNPNARGKAENVERAAERTARKNLAPLINSPTRRSKISVKRCERTAQRPWSLCTVTVDGVAADCTLRVRLRVFPSGTYSAYGRSLRCR